MSKEADIIDGMLIKKNSLTLSVTANIFIFVRCYKNPVIPLVHKQLI